MNLKEYADRVEFELRLMTALCHLKIVVQKGLDDPEKMLELLPNYGKVIEMLTTDEQIKYFYNLIKYLINSTHKPKNEEEENANKKDCEKSYTIH